MLLVIFCADGCTNQIQGKDDRQKPAAPVSAIPQQQHSGGPFDGDEQKDIHADIKIVNPPQKDFYDKAPVWVDLALVFAALLTLWTIKRQADLMKEQSDLTAEMNRAKLRIELDPFQAVPDQSETYNIHGRVTIYGNSEAFITRSEIYASIGPGGIFNPLPEWSWGIHSLPEVIKAHADPIPFTTMVIADDGPADAKEILPVSRAEAEIHVMVKIEFRDAYRRDWELRLRRRFKFLWNLADYPEPLGNWENSGPPNDNGEYRIKKPPFLPILWLRLRYYWRSRGGRRIPRPN